MLAKQDRRKPRKIKLAGKADMTSRICVMGKSNFSGLFSILIQGDWIKSREPIFAVWDID